jgi:3-hydroxyacyl-CoA dehydrogenase/enoyl-CoA hydratase/3-hydroxybutyryl-CoA epimerase
MTKYNNFTLSTDPDGIALVTWDMPDKSMNVFTEEVIEELGRIVEQVTGDASVKGVVITSGKESFSGGADLTMLQRMLGQFRAEDAKDHEKAVAMLFEGAGRMSQLFRKIETSGKPWVSAINGTCMGGAFELSLACHGRVAADSEHVKMALPEIKVGLFPGAGGTQRVPRLANTQEALQMLTSGQTLSPKKAKGMNLIHDIVEPGRLIDAAKAMIAAGLKPVAPWDEKGFKLPGGPVYSAAGANLWPPAIAILRRETHGNYPAAAAILKCVYEGLLVPFDTALRIEQRYFAEILQTKEAAMMIRSLFVSLQELNKGARRPAGVPPTRFKKIGVLGAGFMGAGIAYVTAKAGIPVALLDRDMPSAEKGKAHSAGLMDGLIKKGRATEEEKEKLLSLITPTADYADLEGSDLVIEAVFEDSEVKKGATEKAEAVLKPAAIFASNTSTIPITGLAKNSARPKNFIGIHFFSPVDRMMLVEIILGKKTSDTALATALDYVRTIRKTPIVVNDSRGFYANRCVLRFLSEGHQMLLEGIPAAMIENTAKMAGMPVGPLSLTDEVAIDLALKITKATEADLGPDAIDQNHKNLLVEMVEKRGRLGRKNGKGFYDYPAQKGQKRLWPGLSELQPKTLTADELDRLGPAFVEELKQRFLVVQAVEAARTVEDKVITDMREADVGSILGFGFAPFTGGTLSYIDMMGTKKFVELCKKLEKKHGERFKPPRLLVDMAKKGETFYGRFASGQKAAA